MNETLCSKCGAYWDCGCDVKIVIDPERYIEFEQMADRIIETSIREAIIRAESEFTRKQLDPRIEWGSIYGVPVTEHLWSEQLLKDLDAASEFFASVDDPPQ